MEPAAVGIDLGATKIASALVDLRGEVLAARTAPTLPEQGPRAVIHRIAAQTRALLASAPAAVMGVGIGSPGGLDPVRGVVLNAVNLAWIDVPICQWVTESLGVDLPVRLQTDTASSALGELYFGAARGIQHALYLSLGSGFGGGVIANGQLVTGAHHLAGGIGHYAMDPQGGDPCTCGLQGCPETVLSGQALVRRVQKRAASGDGPTHGLAEPDLSPERVVRAAELADPLALLALAETGRLIGAVAGPYVAVMNPQRIILGGGLGLAAFPFLAPAILEELGRRVLPACLDGLEIVPSRLRSSAVGAACLVFESLHLASRAGFSAIQAGLGGPPGEDSLQGDGHERA